MLVLWEKRSRSYLRWQRQRYCPSPKVNKVSQVCISTIFIWIFTSTKLRGSKLSWSPVHIFFIRELVMSGIKRPRLTLPRTCSNVYSMYPLIFAPLTLFHMGGGIFTLTLFHMGGDIFTPQNSLSIISKKNCRPKACAFLTRFY